VRCGGGFSATLAVEVSPELVQSSSLVPPPPVLVEYHIEPESTRALGLDAVLNKLFGGIGR
jgi:hypothetical protein